MAHLYLSGSDPDVMIGNFIGDFVKGRNQAEHFSAGIVKGIDLHRTIDAFTDSHAVVSQSKKRLFPAYRHYAGVIVDIYYDHFLAKDWSRYHADPLPDYAAACYALLASRKKELPEQVTFMLPYMMQGNWLVNYGKLEGIHRALSGMARRASFVSKMEEAVKDLEMHYELFQQEFDVFFPQLKKHADAVVKQF